MDPTIIIESIIAMGTVYCTILFLLCIMYFTIVPYYIAKHFRISDNFGIDCIISYGCTIFFGIIGNLVYILFSILIKNQSNNNNII